MYLFTYVLMHKKGDIYLCISMYEEQVYVGGHEEDKRICLCTFVCVHKVYCTPINVHAIIKI